MTQARAIIEVLRARPVLTSQTEDLIRVDADGWYTILAQDNSAQSFSVQSTISDLPLRKHKEQVRDQIIAHANSLGLAVHPSDIIVEHSAEIF